MTPKQKANELYMSFRMLQIANEDEDDETFNPNSRAKQCALICCDKILSIFDGLHKPEYCAFDAIGERKFTYNGEYDTHMTGYDMVEYWNEVKLEIEKL